MKHSKGFTLVEVLLTSVILTLGTLLLHQVYLKMAEHYGRYTNGMRLQGWIGDELWAARESIVYSSGEAAPLPTGGSVTIGPKTFQWTREMRPMPGRGLYTIRMDVEWLEGNKPAHLTREVYAMRRDIV